MDVLHNSFFRNVLFGFVIFFSLVFIISPFSAYASGAGTPGGVIGEVIHHHEETEFDNVYRMISPGDEFWGIVKKSSGVVRVGVKINSVSSESDVYILGIYGGDGYNKTYLISDRPYTVNLNHISQSSVSDPYYFSAYSVSASMYNDFYFVDLGFNSGGNVFVARPYVDVHNQVPKPNYRDLTIKYFKRELDGFGEMVYRQDIGVPNNIYYDTLFLRTSNSTGENELLPGTGIENPVTPSSGNQNDSVDPENGIYRYHYDSLSTTGIDMTAPGTKIAIYKSEAYTIGEGGDKIFTESGKKMLIGIFDATKLTFDLPMLYDMDKVKDFCDDVESPSIISTIFNRALRNDMTYIRIINSSGFGPFLKTQFVGKNGGLDVTHTEDPNGKIITESEGGFSSADISASVGDGKTFDQAQDEANENRQFHKDQSEGNFFGIGDTNDLIKQIGNFPKIISVVFSFLPSWVLWLIGFCFSAWVIAMLIRVIRG